MRIVHLKGKTGNIFKNRFIPSFEFATNKLFSLSGDYGLNRALVGATPAIITKASVNNILVVTFGNCSFRTFAFT
jgi:hypothetical protein